LVWEKYLESFWACFYQILGKIFCNGAASHRNNIAAPEISFYKVRFLLFIDQKSFSTKSSTSTVEATFLLSDAVFWSCLVDTWIVANNVVPPEAPAWPTQSLRWSPPIQAGVDPRPGLVIPQRIPRKLLQHPNLLFPPFFISYFTEKPLPSANPFVV